MQADALTRQIGILERCPLDIRALSIAIRGAPILTDCGDERHVASKGPSRTTKWGGALSVKQIFHSKTIMIPSTYTQKQNFRENASLHMSSPPSKY